MFKPFFASKKYFWRAYGRAVLMIGLTVLNVWLNIEVGRIIGEVSRLLEQGATHTMDDFWEKFQWFMLYRAGFVLSDPVLSYNSRVFAIDWRKALTEIFIPHWGWIIGRTKLRGISQRLQEEPYNFSKFFDSMGLQLIHSVLAICGFGLELSNISPTKFHYHFASWEIIPAQDITIGVIPLVALAVFAIGLVGAVLLGWWLPRAENHNRDKEADFRKHAELVEDGDIPFNAKSLLVFFDLVQKSYLLYFRKAILLDIWKSLYYNSIAIIPWIIGAHWILVSKILTLGGLPQIVYNFEICMGGFSIFINNWRQIVDFIATKNRLKDLTTALNEPTPVNYWEKSPYSRM
jgi:peptide/bleomycin uptake transporter